MKSLLFLLFILISFNQYTQTVHPVFSEVMFSPQSGNNEFIEIYNPGSQPINLSGYKIRYETSKADSIIAVNGSAILLPNSYALIFEGDYDIAGGVYNNLVPPSAIVLKIADNSFGTSGMSNTSDRTLKLISPLNDTVNIYTYTANNNSGYSDEKKNILGDNTLSNWGNSNKFNGTPGFTNSIALLNHNISISGIVLTPAHPVIGDDIAIKINIKNNGSSAAENIMLQVFDDPNMDSLVTAEDLIFINSYNLSPSDSISAVIEFPSEEEGDKLIVAKITYSPDQDTSDNLKYLPFAIYPPGTEYNDIVVNEIMYAPSGGEPEWIELYNKSNSDINIKDWIIEDITSSYTLTDDELILPPESFLVISRSAAIVNFYSISSQLLITQIPQLNNNGDAVVIKNQNGRIIDSVNYNSSWGGTGGRSLERKLYTGQSNGSTNWGSASGILKATPGKVNTLSPKEYDPALISYTLFPPYPVKGEDVSVKIKVKNKGLLGVSFNSSLYDDLNNDSIPDNLISVSDTYMLPASDSVEIQFLNIIRGLNNKITLIASINCVSDQDTSNNKIIIKIVPGLAEYNLFINEIMYTPAGGEPEWIELYNDGSDTINIKDFYISDILSTPSQIKIEKDISIYPDSYLVICRDSSIYNYHSAIPSPVTVIQLPVLNNDADGVIIKDSRGLTIDSVMYSYRWGCTAGYSLERKSTVEGSNNAANWGSSQDIENSSPGRVNSISRKKFDVAIREIITNPEAPLKDEEVTISARIVNRGKYSAEDIQVEFYYADISDTTSLSLFSSINISNLNDSILVISDHSIILDSEKFIKVKLVYVVDQDSSNNIVSTLISPGGKVSSVVINEIMYAPIANEPEWVELHNNSGNTIDIKGWEISDILPKPEKKKISDSSIILRSGDYLILTNDSSLHHYYNYSFTAQFINLPSLSNTGDGVIIYDRYGSVIDSVLFKTTWGGKNGYSLERAAINSSSADSSNWGSCVDSLKATPGKMNSLCGLSAYKNFSMVINEIMFDPAPGNADFIEFYNQCNDTINSAGWNISDEKGNRIKIAETPIRIPPGEYLLLSADSSVLNRYGIDAGKNIVITNSSSLGLSNTGESIILKDAKGNTIDSVCYNSKWHNKGFVSTKDISLERISFSGGSNDPNNWSSSVSPMGATPASANSIFIPAVVTENPVVISPNPFSPDDDGFEDAALININLLQPVSQVRVRVYDSKGRLVRTILNNSPSAGVASIPFNGLDDDGNRLSIGIYIILLEAFADSSPLLSHKTVVVIAQRL
jgi:hypothetical protein